MWYFIITDESFQVFEILPDCVRPSDVFYVPTFKAALDGVLSYIRRAYDCLNVNVDVDNASFDMDGTLVGVVKVVLV